MKKFLLLLLLISHCYNDILVTTRHGMDFWKILFDGDFLQFYNINRVASGNDSYTGVQGCAYNILVYIVFAIWNFPLYLVDFFTNIEPMNNIFCIIWAKLLVATAFFASAYLLVQILKELNISEKMQQMATMLYLSSALMLGSIFIVGGYDILSVCIMLLGFLAYLKKKHKWFLFWFSIAICFKYFALFALVPLLLLRQKKVLLLMRDGLLSLVIYALTSIPFTLVGSTQGGLASSLFFTVFGAQDGIFHWFVLAYGVVCIVAYMTQSDDLAYENQVAIWLVFGAYASFFGLCNAYPYWVVYLIPFMVMLIANNAGNYRINILLETVGTIALLAHYYLYYWWCYFGVTLNSMLWKYVTPDLLNHPDSWVQLGQQSELLQLLVGKGSGFCPMFRAAFILACVALAYFNFPKKEQMQKATQFTVEYDVFILRWIGMLGVVLIPIVVMLVAPFF